METPLISVIVPVYNVEKYLEQCIESIIGQTYRNLDIILIDDGSSDGGPAICDEYEKRDSRIHVIHQKNRGLSAARNVGMSVCRGEYIAFVDSDDWIELNMFEVLMEQIREKNLDTVFCTARIIDDIDNHEIRFDYFPEGTIRTPSEMVKDTLTDYVGGQVWNRLSAKSCWKNVKFPEGRVYEDLAISFYPFVNSTKPTEFIKQPLYNYRMNPNGISLTLSEKNRYHIFLAFKEHYEYAKLNVQSVVATCLNKTVIHGLSFYNCQISSSNQDCQKWAHEVRTWMSTMCQEIVSCGEIAIEKKMQALLLIKNEALYCKFHEIIQMAKGGAQNTHEKK